MYRIKFTTRFLLLVTTIVAILVYLDQQLESKLCFVSSNIPSALASKLDSEHNAPHSWLVTAKTIRNVTKLSDRLRFRRCLEISSFIVADRNDNCLEVHTDCKSKLLISLSGSTLVTHQEGPTITMWN